MASAGWTLESIGVHQLILGRNNFENHKADCWGRKTLAYFRTGTIRHFTYYVSFNWGL
ncbi:hypothetical protein X741_29760 [Mesorhizobium sp. LNHC229A00]|nr:hypothetical protein X741_29760 [Mesorhizobium sp. LNHC229A00]